MSSEFSIVDGALIAIGSACAIAGVYWLSLKRYVQEHAKRARFRRGRATQNPEITASTSAPRSARTGANNRRATAQSHRRPRSRRQTQSNEQITATPVRKIKIQSKRQSSSEARLRLTPNQTKKGSHDVIRIDIESNGGKKKSSRSAKVKSEKITVGRVDSGFGSLLEEARKVARGEESPLLPNEIEVKRRYAVCEKNGLAPFRFQKIGVQDLAKHRRRLLFDDMGLGKTVQVLLAAPDRGKAGILVICPKSVQLNWKREALRWRPEYKGSVHCLVRTEDFRFPKHGELLIAKWGSLPKRKLGLNRAASFALVVDEAHYAKNPNAERTKRARALAEMADICWVLTGTPLPNKALDLWHVVRLADLHRCLGPESKFEDSFFSSSEGGRIDQAEDPLPELLRLIALRRKKSEVLTDLPERRYAKFYVTLAKSELKGKLDQLLAKYKSVKKLKAELEQSIHSASFASDLMSHISTLRVDLAMAKLIPAMEQINELLKQGRQVVVFSCHRGPIKYLAKQQGWGSIDGDSSTRDRETTVDRFQSGRLKGLGITLAAAEGITLTASADLIRIDLYWNPGKNIQVEDRLCRIGQSQRVLITDLIADHPVDEIVQDILRAKTRVLQGLDLI